MSTNRAETRAAKLERLERGRAFQAEPEVVAVRTEMAECYWCQKNKLLACSEHARKFYALRERLDPDYAPYQFDGAIDASPPPDNCVCHTRWNAGLDGHCSACHPLRQFDGSPSA